MTRKRIAVLGSGGGSNFEALSTHLERMDGDAPCEVVVVASDRRDAGILTRAEKRGLRSAQLRDSTDAAELLGLLEEHAVDMVVLAGYLRLVPRDVVARFAGAMLNVHPALLPHFGGEGMYGDRVHRAVLESGATVTGVTVHLVSNDYDRGEIMAQWPVPVFAGDTVRSLAERVLAIEHILYPVTIAAVARGAAGAGQSCRFVSEPGDQGIVFSAAALSEEQLRRSIELLASITQLPGQERLPSIKG